MLETRNANKLDYNFRSKIYTKQYTVGIPTSQNFNKIEETV